MRVPSIDRFTGEFRFLSNFYPCQVSLDGDLYPTVEHAYQAAKTLDSSWRARIRIEPRPGVAKRIGRQAPLRAEWEGPDFRLGIMFGLLWQKFHRGSELGIKLQATKAYDLVEGNTWGDKFWGECKGQGENWLGKLLMQIRDGGEQE